MASNIYACDGDACSIVAPADMSAYEGLVGSSTFVSVTARDVIDGMDEGKTFAVIFSFARCPWCVEAMPVLDRAAKANDMKVNYVNTRPDPSVRRNSEIPNFDELKAKIGEYFPKDDNGEPFMDVPIVFFIKDGKMKDVHYGTLPWYDATERHMTEEEKEELFSHYDRKLKELK